MWRYNAKSYRRACCRSEKAYFNFINHIIPYIILTSTKFLICPYNFRKYQTYCELVKFGIWRNLRANDEMPWPHVTKLYTIWRIYIVLRKTAIFRERMSAIPSKFLQLTQNICRIRCINIRLFKKSKGCDTAWQQDDERMSPFQKLSWLP